MPSKLKRGMYFYDRLGKAHIMAVVDGYVMARRYRCYPFVISERDVVESLIRSLPDAQS